MMGKKMSVIRIFQKYDDNSNIIKKYEETIITQLKYRKENSKTMNSRKLFWKYKNNILIEIDEKYPS